jgi:hypothetical protein
MKWLSTAVNLAMTLGLTTILPVNAQAPESIASQAAPASAVQPMSSTPAQATLPDGFALYEGQKDQFTIAIPPGWVARDRSQILQLKESSPSPFNITYFYLPPQNTPQDAATPEELRKTIRGIATGDIPAFFVQKLQAEDGMSCDGFSEKAQRSVFNILNSDTMFSLRALIVELPRSEPISLGGCKGVRVYGTGQADGESTPRTTDINAVSDGKILYLFALRATADNYKKNAEIFKKSVSTAKITGTK